MRRNPLAVMEDLDRLGREPRPEPLLQQLVRDRVVVPVDLDMVVEADLALLPLGVLVRLRRLPRRTIAQQRQITGNPGDRMSRNR